jgi:hypothetical protein
VDDPRHAIFFFKKGGAPLQDMLNCMAVPIQATPFQSMGAHTNFRSIYNGHILSHPDSREEFDMVMGCYSYNTCHNISTSGSKVIDFS